MSQSKMTPELGGMKAWSLDLWGQALEIWSKGGWAMIAIAVISFFMSIIGFHVWIRLSANRLNRVSEKRWRTWLTDRTKRQGRLGQLMNDCLDGRNLKAISLYFDQLRATESAPFERDLKAMKICVSAAPLVGLLGTVTGMLSTFGALATGSGGDQTMGMIAAGISEALITTETGLVVALPGLFFHHFLERKFAALNVFLAHLETTFSQDTYRRQQEQGDTARVTMSKIRARLRGHLESSRSQPLASLAVGNQSVVAETTGETKNEQLPPLKD